MFGKRKYKYISIPDDVFGDIGTINSLTQQLLQDIKDEAKKQDKIVDDRIRELEEIAWQRREKKFQVRPSVDINQERSNAIDGAQTRFKDYFERRVKQYSFQIGAIIKRLINYKFER